MPKTNQKRTVQWSHAGARPGMEGVFADMAGGGVDDDADSMDDTDSDVVLDQDGNPVRDAEGNVLRETLRDVCLDTRDAILDLGDILKQFQALLLAVHTAISRLGAGPESVPSSDARARAAAIQLLRIDNGEAAKAQAHAMSDE